MRFNRLPRKKPALVRILHLPAGLRRLLWYLLYIPSGTSAYIHAGGGIVDRKYPGGIRVVYVLRKCPEASEQKGCEQKSVTCFSYFWV